MVDRQDLLTLYGLVVKYYVNHPVAGAGLILWGDLQVLFASQEGGKASFVWQHQHLWQIRSWRLYTLSNVHVLETVSGEVVYMFADVSYPFLVKLMERMLKHKLEIDKDVVGNDMTTAEHLIQVPLGTLHNIINANGLQKPPPLQSPSLHNLSSNNKNITPLQTPRSYGSTSVGTNAGWHSRIPREGVDIRELVDDDNDVADDEEGTKAGWHSRIPREGVDIRELVDDDNDVADDEEGTKPLDIPPKLYNLFTSQCQLGKMFRKNIRAYNTNFSFASMGVTLDKRYSSKGSGVYTFRVQGGIYHRIDQLVPRDGDPRVELTASVKVDQRLYNHPTTSEVAGIWVEGNENITTYKKSIVVYGRSKYPTHIQPYFACYDPLSYPLFFPNGEVGWHSRIPREGVDIRELVDDEDDVLEDEEGTKCPCMEGELKKCRWNYPRQFQETTQQGDDSYPLYRRRDNGIEFITFEEDVVLTDILKKERNKRSMLTAFFELNQTDTEARQHLYKDISKFYTWNKSTRKWNRRKQGKIRGRMVSANPAEGERTTTNNMTGEELLTHALRFPLILLQTQFCNIKKQSGLAKLLCQAKLIIWDEASMAKRQAVEAIDRTMQDITEVKLPFGGKIFLGGDFGQDALINEILTSFATKAHSSVDIVSKAILSTKNEHVDSINDMLIDRFLGEEKVYYSFDEAKDDTHNYYPLEFLNSLNVSGLPCPIILLRNLDLANGLCNGTRLICKRFDPNVINAKIAVEQHARVRVLLLRIPLAPSEKDMFPFKLKRTKFPV
nr:ATP-dependent DNA helicase PIF1-like [Tanacetum cinerariifolium]